MPRDARLENSLRLTAERSAQMPDLCKFVDYVSPILERRGDVSECMEAFAQLASGTVLTQLVNLELKKFLENEKHIPLMSFVSQIILAETALFQLNLALLTPRSSPRTGRASSLPSAALIAVCANELALAQYLQPEPYPCDIFRPTAALNFLGVRTYSRGSVLHLRAGYDVVEFLPSPGDVTLLLSFSPKNFLQYSWEYDLNSLLPVRAIPGDERWSRVDYATQLFGAAANPEYINTMRALADGHPAHFVRWSAIRAAVAMDFEVGINLVRHAAEDAHPDVRSAASRTLDRFYSNPQKER